LTDSYISFYETFIKERTLCDVAVFILEPAQDKEGGNVPCKKPGIMQFLPAKERNS